MTTLLSEHAKELAKLGASKGGKARASALTPEHRKEIAQAAVRARWDKVKGVSSDKGQVSDHLGQVEETPIPARANAAQLPFAPFQGTLDFGSGDFACYVLNNGKRVIAQREIVGVLTGNKKGNLDRYLNASQLNKYIDSKKIADKAVQFVVPGSQAVSNGYEATVLVEICDAYLRARADEALGKQQEHLAKQAEIIMRSCAKLGIEALVDEATGYQAVRAKNALQLKLQAFIAEEMQEWARMFPDDFWIQLARLENVHYSARSRPLRWGKYVMAFVYDAVDKDMGKELRKKNPNPEHGRNHHQWLKEFGRTKVRDHLNQVLGVMKTCATMDEFNKKFGYVFNKDPMQMTFFDLVDDANALQAGRAKAKG